MTTDAILPTRPREVASESLSLAPSPSSFSLPPLSVEAILLVRGGKVTTAEVANAGAADARDVMMAKE